MFQACPLLIYDSLSIQFYKFKKYSQDLILLYGDFIKWILLKGISLSKIMFSLSRLRLKQKPLNFCQLFTFFCFKIIQLLQKMRDCINHKTAYLFFTFLFYLFIVGQCTSSVSPAFISNIYFESDQVEIKTNINTYFNSLLPISRTITFLKAYTQTPQLAYSIKNYRCNDVLWEQDFILVLDSLTTGNFKVTTEISGLKTNIRILTMNYLAVSKDFPYHLNAFYDFPLNYLKGPLTDITGNMVGTRQYKNVVNYTALANTASAPYNVFGSDLLRNTVALFISGFKVVGVQFSTTLVQFNTVAKVQNTEEFSIEVKVLPNYSIDQLRFSLVIFDNDDIEKDGLCRIVYSHTVFSGSIANTVALPHQFVESAFLGLMDYSALTSNYGMQFNIQIDTLNNQVIIPQSIVPWLLSIADGGLSTYQISVFYVQLKGCTLPNIYFNYITKMCEDTCQSYYYGNIAGQKCQSCNFACYQCINGPALGCTYCNPLDNRQLIGTSCKCLTGYFQDASLSSTVCLVCPSLVGCIQCLNSLECSICDSASGYFLDSTSNLCQMCLIAHCLDCASSTQCNTCDAANNYVLNQSSFQCDLCSIAQCLNCLTLTQCSICNTASNYFLNSLNLCQSCTLVGCITCFSLLQCSTCDSAGAYFLNPTTHLCQLCTLSGCATCSTSTACSSCLPSGYFLDPSSTCTQCSINYDTHCLNCNSTSCISCQSGYIYNSITLACDIAAVVCGDGFWNQLSQQCDDGNLDINDGCNSQCKIQTDFVCPLADVLPSGASLCKYSKDIKLQLSYFAKEPSANTVHIFFNVVPSFLKDWDQNQIENLIKPVQLVDQVTGVSNIIPYNKLTFLFQKNKQQNQIQIVIEYGQSNLEDRYLKFNIAPSQTNISSIAHLASATNLNIKLNSGNSGMYLYAYSDEVYHFQSILQIGSMTVGFLSICMLFIGMCVPFGKLIIVEALCAVQLTFFSVLQYHQISPTFQPFKYLLYSNGYNNPNIFSYEKSQITSTVYSLIGLENNLISNYNISFFLFIFFFFLSIFALIILKICRNKSQTEASLKQTDEMQPNKKIFDFKGANPKIKSSSDFLKVIIKRIFLELCFFSLIVPGYLVWVTVIKNLAQQNTIGYIYIGVIIGIWILYLGIFLKDQRSIIYFSHYLCKRKVQLYKKIDYGSINGDFGQFKQVLGNEQKCKLENQKQIDKKGVSKVGEKMYIFLSMDRIFISLILVFGPKLFIYTSCIIISLYSIYLILLIIIYRKSQENLKEEQKRPICSYLIKNYTLRQSINFITIIVIQVLYLLMSIIINTEGAYTALTVNIFTIKIIPTTILSILLLNLLFNLFIWIKELRQQNLFKRFKLILTILFPTLYQQAILDLDQTKQKLLSSVKSFKKHQISSKYSKSHQEQQQMINQLNNYLENSPVFKIRNSPFLGAQEKYTEKNQIIGSVKGMNKAQILQSNPNQFNFQSIQHESYQINEQNKQSIIGKLSKNGLDQTQQVQKTGSAQKMQQIQYLSLSRQQQSFEVRNNLYKQEIWQNVIKITRYREQKEASNQAQQNQKNIEKEQDKNELIKNQNLMPNEKTLKELWDQI